MTGPTNSKIQLHIAETRSENKYDWFKFFEGASYSSSNYLSNCGDFNDCIYQENTLPSTDAPSEMTSVSNIGLGMA